MNTPKGCKPFNYEEAIKDLSKVVTRSGSKVIEMHKFNNVGHLMIFCEIDGLAHIQAYYIDGTHDKNKYDDLFLKDETVVYVNVCDTEMGTVLHPTKECAIQYALNAKSISALTISNSEIIKCETVHRY